MALHGATAQQGQAQVVLNVSRFLRSHIVVMGVFVIRSIGLLFDAWPRRRCATQARATLWSL